MPVHPSQADAYNINASEDNGFALGLLVLTHTTEALNYLRVVVTSCRFAYRINVINSQQTANTPGGANAGSDQ